MDKVYDGRLHHPSTFYIAGSTGSGKSVFVKRLIEERSVLFDEPIDKVIWCYSQYQSMFAEPSLKDVEFVQGFDPLKYQRDNGPTLLILDDLMQELGSCPELVSYFTKGRHWNITVCLLLQSLYPKAPIFRTISLNATYFVIFKQVRDQRQIVTFVNQMFPGKQSYAKSAVLDATKDPYSYILVDTRQDTPPELRLRTKIFCTDWTSGYYAQIVYIPR